MPSHRRRQLGCGPTWRVRSLHGSRAGWPHPPPTWCGSSTSWPSGLPSDASSSIRCRGRTGLAGPMAGRSPSTWWTAGSARPQCWTRRRNCFAGLGPTSAPVRRWPQVTRRRQRRPGLSPAIAASCWSWGQPALARRPCCRPPSRTLPTRDERLWVWRPRERRRTCWPGRRACRLPRWPSCSTSTAARGSPTRMAAAPWDDRGPRRGRDGVDRRPLSPGRPGRPSRMAAGVRRRPGPVAGGGPRRDVRPLVRDRSDSQPGGGPPLHGGLASGSQLVAPRR